jgi:hypothetical protein
MATATVYFNDVVGGIGWFATSVAGWVVCKQCLSVASICQVVGCVLSGHCRELLRSSDTDAHTGNAPVRLSPNYMTGLGGLCPPQFREVPKGAGLFVFGGQPSPFVPFGNAVRSLGVTVYPGSPVYGPPPTNVVHPCD